MSHINEPPAVLGAMIGGALVGTFLGVLMAYGMAGPVAARMKGVVEEEAKYLEVIRAVPGDPPPRQRAADQRRDGPQDGAQRAYADLPGAGDGGAGRANVTLDAACHIGE